MFSKQRNPVHLATAVVVGCYCLFFLATRVTLFARSYSNAALQKEQHSRFRDLCLSHAELREVDADRCAERSMLADLSPFWLALEGVSQKTYSCGYVPCTDVLASSSTTLMYMVFAAFSALLLYAVLARIVAPNAANVVRPQESLLYGGPRLYSLESANCYNEAYMRRAPRLLDYRDDNE